MGNGKASLPVRVMTFKKPYAVLGAILGTGSNSTTGVFSSGRIEESNSVGIGLTGGGSVVAALSEEVVGDSGSGGVTISDDSGSDVGASVGAVGSGGRFSGDITGDSGTDEDVGIGGKSGADGKAFVSVAGVVIVSVTSVIDWDSVIVSCAGWARR